VAEGLAEKAEAFQAGGDEIYTDAPAK